MSKDGKKVINGQMVIGEDFKERVVRLLPLANDFVTSKDPEDVLEYTKSMDSRDAYVLGLIIGMLIKSKY